MAKLVLFLLCMTLGACAGKSQLDKARENYAKKSEHGSLVVLARHLKEGMTYQQMTDLLGADNYSPIDGQYYYSSDSDEWVEDAQRKCNSGLVVEFRTDGGAEVTPGITGFELTPICE